METTVEAYFIEQVPATLSPGNRCC